MTSPTAAGSDAACPVPRARLVAVIDDDESVRDSIGALLRSVGCRVRTFPSAESFLDSHTLAETACLIVDVRMPGMAGLALQDRLNGQGSVVPIVFITAHEEGFMRQRALEKGAMDMLRKPFAASELLAVVEAGLESGAGCRGAAPAAVSGEKR